MLTNLVAFAFWVLLEIFYIMKELLCFTIVFRIWVLTDFTVYSFDHNYIFSLAMVSILDYWVWSFTMWGLPEIYIGIGRVTWFDIMRVFLYFVLG